MVKGWGFVNDNLEILCIKTKEGNQKCLELVPWREADPKEVIIMWDPNIDILKSIIKAVPYNSIISDGELDLESLEPMHVEKDEKTIWIG